MNDMKKKLLIISAVLFFVCLITAVVCFFLMKNSEAEAEPDAENSQEYDMSETAEKLEFLRFTSYEKLKAYADDYPVYIQKSDDESLFGIGELYIDGSPVELFYQLSADRSFNRFDGKYTVKLQKSDSDSLWELLVKTDRLASEFFITDYFEHDMLDAEGCPLDAGDESTYELMLNGKAFYNLSVIDEVNTYWNISAAVTDKKQVTFEFFRCFDLSEYDDDTPNIDLRPIPYDTETDAVTENVTENNTATVTESVTAAAEKSAEEPPAESVQKTEAESEAAAAAEQTGE